MLEIRNLCVRYRDRVAVRDFDLSLAEGEIVTLVGPTGCGKSSVLRAVAGLEKPDAGEIVIGDLRIDRDHFVPPEKRRTGLVFQDFALFPHLTVEQNVGFKAADRSRVDAWIDQLGLDEYRHVLPARLSGGQKQRVALARSLAHQPALVLLDEPLSNLDAAMKSGLRWQVRDALKAAGVPAIWVTHDQDEALSVGDRVGVMNQGRLEQVGDPETCYRAPRTRFVAEFLGEGVFLEGRVDDGCVHTALGCSQLADPASAEAVADGGRVDVLVRPHDLGLAPAENGNARVIWGRYEGETRLYKIRLDAGFDLKARVGHELRFDEGQAVDAHIDAGHPLALFGAERA
jgi:iron(III) transport system ATP-binding protein